MWPPTLQLKSVHNYDTHIFFSVFKFPKNTFRRFSFSKSRKSSWLDFCCTRQLFWNQSLRFQLAAPIRKHKICLKFFPAQNIFDTLIKINRRHKVFYTQMKPEKFQIMLKKFENTKVENKWLKCKFLRPLLSNTLEFGKTSKNTCKVLATAIKTKVWNLMFGGKNRSKTIRCNTLWTLCKTIFVF